MLDMLPLFVALAILAVALAGFAYTLLRALNAVQKEDIALLKADINGVKTDIAQDIADVKAIQRADTDRLENNRREDTARLEKSIADINIKFDRINDKFDRYLFGKLEKTDDKPDATDKGK